MKNSKFNDSIEKTDEKTLNEWLIYLLINCGNQNSITSFLKKIKYKI